MHFIEMKFFEYFKVENPIYLPSQGLHLLCLWSLPRVKLLPRNHLTPVRKFLHPLIYRQRQLRQSHQGESPLLEWMLPFHCFQSHLIIFISTLFLLIYIYITVWYYRLFPSSAAPLKFNMNFQLFFFRDFLLFHWYRFRSASVR